MGFSGAYEEEPSVLSDSIDRDLAFWRIVWPRDRHSYPRGPKSSGFGMLQGSPWTTVHNLSKLFDRSDERAPAATKGPEPRTHASEIEGSSQSGPRKTDRGARRYQQRRLYCGRRFRPNQWRAAGSGIYRRRLVETFDQFR